MFHYQHYVTVRKYRDKYKIVVMPGYDPNDHGSSLKLGCSSYDEKLDCSVSRSRGKIYEYAYCNDWDWFVTMTLDPKKYDRYDLDTWHKDLTKWLNNYKRKIGNKIDFLLIPEKHNNGAWHIHGLLAGLPESVLSPFPEGTPLYGSEYLNWQDYSKKFGYCSVGAVKSHEAVCGYVTKYATKDLSRLVSVVGAPMYYVSRGLNISEEYKKDFVYTGFLNMSFDYEGKYCSVKWVDDLPSVNRVFDQDDTIHNIDLDLSDFEELEV